MKVVEVYEKLIASRRPIDFFGSAKSEDDLKKIYRKFCKIVHPDLVHESEKYYANESIVILNRLYEQGVKELSDGVYDAKTSSEKYKKSNPLFEIETGGEKYTFYEHVASGDVANVFKGTCNGNIYYIKVPFESKDSDLIKKEFEILSKVRHQSLPYVENSFVVNKAKVILSREVEGVTCEELLRQYPNGVPAEHVLWMMERLFSVVGFLHYNCVVHGNITPENILINKKNHNVTLFGFCFAIQRANEPDAKYKFFNDYYSAPEILNKVRVEPSTDIYSIGKIAVKLMGGNVSNGGLPMHIDKRVREFIRGLCKEEPLMRDNDAWMIYRRLQDLRTEVYGEQRFKQLR